MTGGHIINADASQIYRELPILSAQPSPAEQARAPHHLFGVADGAAACSTAAWRDLALPVLESCWQTGDVPIVVGGTGLNFRTLLDGIAAVPGIDAGVRTAVRALTTADLRAALEREDPALAARLNPADRQRQARALEVVRATGVSLAVWQSRTTGGLAGREGFGPICKIVLLPDRAALYARCDARFGQMLAAGAQAEVAALLARHLDRDLPVMKAVGVPELASHLRGQTDLAAASTAACQATRRYAKRQYTWMRNQFADWTRLEMFGDQVNFDELVILLRKYPLTVK